MGKKINIRRTLVFHDYYARLKTIAMSMFKWDGLPPTCDAEFLEECLYDYGQAIFVEDSDMSYLTLKCTPSGELNVYNKAVSYTAHSTGYSKIYDIDDCVVIRNNYLSKSTDSTIILFAERLAKLELSSDVNINGQKTPLLIKCEDKTKNSLKAVYNQYEGDEPVIFVSKSMQDKPIEVLRTDAPFVADKLREEKRAVWNEALEFLGLNTNPSDKKKERLIVNEVDANNEQIDIQCDCMLLTRQQACEMINKKYGLNVTVSKRVNEHKDTMEEGEEDGEIHN